MSGIRQFWLTSENDPTVNLDLMDKETFGSKPNGLGISVSSNSHSAGQDIVHSDYNYSYNNISFTLILGYLSENPYTTYETVVNKLAKGGLLLHYKPSNEMEEHVRNVEFVSISKGEIDYSLGLIGSSLELAPSTPWYVWKDTRGTITQTFYNTNITKLRAIISSSVSLATTQKRLLELNNTGCVHLAPNKEIPCKLRVRVNSTGLTSFKMELYDKNLDKLQTCEFKYNLSSGDYINFTSDFLDPKCTITRGSTEIDITRYMTTASNGFMRLPANEKCYLYLALLQDWNTTNDSIFVRIEKVTV